MHCKSNRTVNLLLGLLLAAGFTGCGGKSDAPPLGKVSGTVLLDGKPEEGIKVFFESQASSRMAVGETDKDGKFTLYYSKNLAGAPLGKCRVKFDQPMQPEKGIHFGKLPRKYFLNSEIEKEVVAGDNKFSFELSSEGAPTMPSP